MWRGRVAGQARGQVGVTLPPNVGRHFERMTARPAVQRVREIRGEA
ncbi:hypothetical protein EKPJFOCH_2330 [Methylobacterium thuringiense]|uniref:Uncharacterized protein n=1 Tax=Methylobacterium thuringiense TaxID=1003091 RepID=A0ABQ4TNF2_9HYPH|nr:hypothetical protein EKPJFOCH_2330 [Methylobacterium thuringiense]